MLLEETSSIDFFFFFFCLSYIFWKAWNILKNTQIPLAFKQKRKEEIKEEREEGKEGQRQAVWQAKQRIHFQQEGSSSH